MTFLLPRIPLNLMISGLILAGCLALRIADPAPVARFRLSAFDTYLRASPRPVDTNFPVRVVAIDEASLASVGQWPWPRTKLAELVLKLTAAGARLIAFDLVLAEPDRLSPDELLRALSGVSISTDLEREITKLPSNDEQLAAALAKAPSVLSVVGEAGKAKAITQSHASFTYAGDDPSAFVRAYAGGIGNLPILTEAAAGLGAVNWLPSEDQIVRRIPLVVSIAGKLYPSLPLEALRVGSKQSTIFIKSSGGSGIYAFGQRTGIDSVRVGDFVLPSDEHGELWLKFAPSDPHRTVSASTVLNGTFDPSEFNSRYVLIGATATGLLDLRATPLQPSVPGVEIHAQALEQMLAGDHLVRPAYATGAELVFIAAVGALIAWLILRSGALVAALTGGLAIASVIGFSWLAYAHMSLLFDPVYPAISLILLYLASSLATYLQSETERTRIRLAFGHYVAPALVSELANNYDRLRLGGETREVTLLFADVRGFSKLSEGMDAEELIRFVNRLFTPLTETILAHRGTIDKFMGDAVMAFWNAPLEDAEHAKNACRAALEMLVVLSHLNAAQDNEADKGGTSFTPVRMGIGLNTGKCVVGNVGSPERFDYSVLGDVVNVASRFEEATKTFGVEIIVGEQTAEKASGFALLELGYVSPRGKDRPERIFALLGDETLAASDRFRALHEAHARMLEARRAGDVRELKPALLKCRSLSFSAISSFYEKCLADGL